MKHNENAVWGALAVFLCLNFVLFSFSAAQTLKTQKEMQKGALSFQDESFELGKHMLDINTHMLEQLKKLNKELDSLKPSYELLVYQRDRHRELVKELERQIVLKDRSIRDANESYRLLAEGAKIQNEIFSLQMKLYARQKKSLVLTKDGLKKAEEMLAMAKETQKIGEEGIAMAAKISVKIKGMFNFGGGI